jgi:hypothetical protein
MIVANDKVGWKPTHDSAPLGDLTCLATTPAALTITAVDAI